MRLIRMFDLQKKYKKWIWETLGELGCDETVYEITEEHRRGDVYPNENNYTVTQNTGHWMDPNVLVRLLEVLYDEYDKAEEMMAQVCKRREIDLKLDVEIYLDYKEALKSLGYLKNMKEEVTYITKKGCKVNSEGIPFLYEYYIRKTLIPNFDQNQIAAMYEEMLRKFMERRYVGEALENEEVPFESVFTMFDSLEEIYRIFEKQLQAG